MVVLRLTWKHFGMPFLKKFIVVPTDKKPMKPYGFEDLKRGFWL